MRTGTKRRMLAAMGLMLAAGFPAAAQLNVSFQTLGTLGNPAGAQSLASAVSGNGDVVVGSTTNAPGSAVSFRWNSAGGLVSLGSLGPNASGANGVSGDGTLTVGVTSITGGQQRGFTWTTPAGPMTALAGLGGQFASANGVSSDGGTIVGNGQDSANLQRAFRMVAGVPQIIGPAGVPSFARAASADGSVVIGWSSPIPGQLQAFRWTSALGIVPLGTLGGIGSAAYSITGDGSTVVGESVTAGATIRAFVWTSSAGMTQLDDPAGAVNSTRAWGVSLDGAVKVGEAFFASTPSSRAVRWNASGVQDLSNLLGVYGVDLAGWTLTTARAADADGSVIVGQAQHTDGRREAFVAHVPPRCLADVSGDGPIDLTDFFQFLNDFDASAPGADVNQDNSIDLADFFDFLNHFDFGC